MSHILISVNTYAHVKFAVHGTIKCASFAMARDHELQLAVGPDVCRGAGVAGQCELLCAVHRDSGGARAAKAPDAAGGVSDPLADSAHDHRLARAARHHAQLRARNRQLRPSLETDGGEGESRTVVCGK